MRSASPPPSTPAGPRGRERALDSDGRVGVLGVWGVCAGLGVCVWSCCVCVCGWVGGAVRGCAGALLTLFFTTTAARFTLLTLWNRWPVFVTFP